MIGTIELLDIEFKKDGLLSEPHYEFKFNVSGKPVTYMTTKANVIKMGKDYALQSAFQYVTRHLEINYEFKQT